MTLASISFFILVAGALGGLGLLALSVLGVSFPRWFGAGHGMLNLVGVAVLFAANLLDGEGVPPSRWWALGILLAALIGGLTFFRALFIERIPLAPACLHGAFALTGLWLLLPAVGLF